MAESVYVALFVLFPQDESRLDRALLRRRRPAFAVEFRTAADSSRATLLGNCGTAAQKLTPLSLQRTMTARSRYIRMAHSIWPLLVIVLIGLVLVAAEIVLRSTSNRSMAGTRVGAVLLPPTWHEIRTHCADILRRASPSGSWTEPFLAFDEQLGWTVAPNRRAPRWRAMSGRDALVGTVQDTTSVTNANSEMYFSSAEGVRSPSPGMAYAGRPQKHRVALIGDELTFGLEVPFEQSWGYYLEQILGSDVQVLNFGVEGYGLDQMYLRYARDVRAWKPDVVLLGLSGADVVRMMAVYPSISFPQWEWPLAKPRFDIATGKLRILNQPVMSPFEMYSVREPRDLPWIEYDFGYDRDDWRWRRRPLLVRYFTSWNSRRGAAESAVDAQRMMAIAGKLLDELLAQATGAGSVLLGVYFPTNSAEDFPDSSNVTGRRLMRESTVPFIDLTDCLRGVERARRTVSGYFVSASANEAIATYVAPRVRQALGDSRKKL